SFRARGVSPHPRPLDTESQTSEPIFFKLVPFERTPNVRKTGQKRSETPLYQRRSQASGLKVRIDSVSGRWYMTPNSGADPRTLRQPGSPPARRMEECIVTLTGRIRVLSVVVLLLAARRVYAQSPPFEDPQWIAEKGMDERFSLNLGGVFQKFGTTLGIGPGSGGEGTNIDLERDLGLGNQTSFRVDGLWRFGRHGRLDFGYAGWTRKNTHTLERTIDVGDHEYGIGASIDFRQHTDVWN